MEWTSVFLKSLVCGQVYIFEVSPSLVWLIVLKIKLKLAAELNMGLSVNADWL